MFASILVLTAHCMAGEATDDTPSGGSPIASAFAAGAASLATLAAPSSSFCASAFPSAVAENFAQASGGGDDRRTDDRPVTLNIGLNLDGIFNTVDDGQGNTTTTGDSTGSLDLGIGKFISERQEIGLLLRGGFQTANDSETATGQVSYLLSYKYHFAPRNVISPYLGIQGGATTRFFPETTTAANGSTSSSTGSATDLSVGAMAGVNVFVEKNTSLFVELNYLATFASNANGGSSTLQDVGLRVGLSFYF